MAGLGKGRCKRRAAGALGLSRDGQCARGRGAPRGPEPGLCVPRGGKPLGTCLRFGL